MISDSKGGSVSLMRWCRVRKPIPLGSLTELVSGLDMVRNSVNVVLCVSLCAYVVFCRGAGIAQSV
jgi:hypothetical protein